MRAFSAIATMINASSARPSETRKPTSLETRKPAIVESCVEPATSATVNTIMIMAGSASEAIITSRLDPMPPKLVPTSRPASARKKRALPSSAMMAMRSADQENSSPVRERRHQRGRDPGGGEDQVGNDAEQPRGIVGQHHVLAHQPHQIAIRLDQRRSSPAQQARLDLAHQPGQQRRQQQHQQHLRTLHDEVEDQGHMASISRRRTRAANTRLRNWRMVRNCRWLSRLAANITPAAIGA